jgi:hypothetical protein
MTMTLGSAGCPLSEGFELFRLVAGILVWFPFADLGAGLPRAFIVL